MEKQAAERETERDEFSKKIEKLESKLRDVQKERLRFENIAKEVCLWSQFKPIESITHTVGFAVY